MINTDYVLILSARLIEVVVRFAFLTLIIRFFTTEEFGQISMTIAILQGVAALIFSASLQTFTFLEGAKKSGLFNFLFWFAIIVTCGLAVIYRAEASVFLFYSVLYLLTGWYTSNNRQATFSFVRAAAFIPPLGTILYQGENLTAASVYFSFLIGAACFLVALPWSCLRQNLYVPDLNLFKKFQAHNVLFQGTKIAERVVFDALLDSRTFGFYAIVRDFTNAVNLTFFSSFYQLYFKRVAMNGVAQFKVAAIKTEFLILLAVLLLSTFFLDVQVRAAANVFFQKEFPPLFFTALLGICAADLLKAIGLMAVESSRAFRKIITLDIVDYFGLLVLALLIPGDLSMGFLAATLALAFRLLLPAVYAYKTYPPS